MDFVAKPMLKRMPSDRTLAVAHLGYRVFRKGGDNLRTILTFYPLYDGIIIAAVSIAFLVEQSCTTTYEMSIWPSQPNLNLSIYLYKATWKKLRFILASDWPSEGDIDSFLDWPSWYVVAPWN